jgi:LytS/YehU family sensor histidine kinase
MAKHHYKACPSMDFSIFVAFFIFISTNFRYYSAVTKEEKQIQNIRIKQIQNELKLLRSHVNPTFLYNSLEYLYSLSNRKSVKISDYILKLSEIIRYMQSSAKNERVYLKDEITFIKKYINLQKLRRSPDTKISFSTSGIKNNTMIEPMLILPFVDNSIKLGLERSMERGFLTINLHQRNHETYFMIESSKVAFRNETTSTKSKTSLKTVTRRLELLYQDKYFLNISETQDTYRVELRLSHEN